MARQLTTKAQVNGYRFVLKRAEHALVRRDVRMLHDPMRSNLQALVIGTIIGMLVLGGCGIWGLIRPHGTVGNATILTVRDDGGMYVVLDATVHPVLNLASARLIAESDEKPTTVSAEALSEYPRGPLLGIPGAPVSLPGSTAGATSTWTVCDTVGADAAPHVLRLSIIGGDLTTGTAPADGAAADSGAAGDASAAVPIAPNEAVLVNAAERTYLVYPSPSAGAPVRAEVDVGSVPVRRALGIDGKSPRPISVGLLNTVAEVDPIAVPALADRGRPVRYADDGIRVGSVLREDGIDGTPGYYVALADGVQRIGEVAAEIFRLADVDAAAPLIEVGAGEVAAYPVSDRLAVTDYPQLTPQLLEPMAAPTLCRSWSRTGGDPRARMTLLVGRGLPLPSGTAPVEVPSADGPGPATDEVYLAPGSGEFVQVTGDQEVSNRAESRFYISDSGVRYGISDAQTGGVLGLGDTPIPAPWSVVSLLPPGPTLTRSAALVAHDGLAPDPDGRAVAPPG